MHKYPVRSQPWPPLVEEELPMVLSPLLPEDRSATSQPEVISPEGVVTSRSVAESLQTELVGAHGPVALGQTDVPPGLNWGHWS